MAPFSRDSGGAEQIECFVIGPIGDPLADEGSPQRIVYENALEVFERVIVPACSDHDLTPIRADHIARPGEITEQLCRAIRHARLVIADVTGNNPNVMYELGLRHTIHKATILIGEFSRLPFDISPVRAERLGRTPGGLANARASLSRAIAEASTGFDPVTATRVWAEAANQPLPPPKDVELEEPGVLDLIPDLFDALGTVTQFIPDVEGVISRFGECAHRFFEEKDRALEPPPRCASLRPSPASFNIGPPVAERR